VRQHLHHAALHAMRARRARAALGRPKITKKPSVTKPMCAIDEYAISFFMSVCTSGDEADVDDGDQRQRDHQPSELVARVRARSAS
jgi:hypothetical protein